MYEGTTDRSQGGTTVDTKITETYLGRNLISGDSANADGYTYTQFVGAIYYASGATTQRYIYLAGDSATSDVTLRTYMSPDYPIYLTITKIKGNKLTTVT